MQQPAIMHHGIRKFTTEERKRNEEAILAQEGGVAAKRARDDMVEEVHEIELPHDHDGRVDEEVGEANHRHVGFKTRGGDCVEKSGGVVPQGVAASDGADDGVNERDDAGAVLVVLEGLGVFFSTVDIEIEEDERSDGSNDDGFGEVEGICDFGSDDFRAVCGGRARTKH